MGFFAWLRKIQHTLHKCAESIRNAEKGERNQQLPPDKPIEVRAVVSFDEKTIADATAQNKSTNATQKSIRNATWAAFFAVAIWSGPLG
jgi:hypothetical protein